MKSAALQKEYNAERIFGRLERLHQDFYPVPHTKELIETSASAKPRHFHLTPRVGGFMKKDDLVRSYNECGQYLHRGSIRRLLTKWYPDIDFQKIRTWNAMIRNLLAPYHYIRLAGGQKVMLCVMNNIDEDNAVQCVLAEVSGEVPSGVSI